MCSSNTSSRLNAPRRAVRFGCALSLWMLHAATASAEPDRNRLLNASPIAECSVQTLAERSEPDYSPSNAVLAMIRPDAEEPLDYYLRTQDGQWAIARDVDADDPWIRLLVFSPRRPVLVDLAVEIDGKPFRAAREKWIDRLLSEAKATFLVREGVAIAESATTEAADTNDDEQTTEKDGTKEADAASEEDPATETDDGPPMVKAQGRQTRTVFARLINYLAAEQVTADREEVRWLLAEWTGGPALLALGPAFSWRRAEIAPLWQTLDRDRDHHMSAAEFRQASSRLEQADRNEDDIVDLREMERLAEGYAYDSGSVAYPLVTVLDDNTAWSTLRRHLLSAYGGADGGDDRGADDVRAASADEALRDRIRAGDSTISSSDLPNLLSYPADIACRVTFGVDGGKVTLLRAGGSPDDALSVVSSNEAVSSNEKAITVELAGATMEISAAQGAPVEEGDMRQTQVAVGAVVDGYPLLRLLDTDDNHRLTLRERRQLDRHLRALDDNDDGRIDATEVPVAIRMAVTHGPHVHEQLDQPIAAAGKFDAPSGVDAPAWFAGMDRNGDGDLSRREFQGSPSQFAQLDRDGDGLISAREVQETTPEGE